MAFAADRGQLHPARRRVRLYPGGGVCDPYGAGAGRIPRGWAAILTALGFISRCASLYRNCRLKPKSSLRTAIGVKHPKIVQKAQGFMGGSFNTREFFHGKTVGLLSVGEVVLPAAAFLLPALLMLASDAGGAGADPGLCSPVFGLLAERWFFFAQANHPQNLYYQSIA
jgi:hypothetical protein